MAGPLRATETSEGAGEGIPAQSAIGCRAPTICRPTTYKVVLELWGNRVMGLVSGEQKPAKVLALRRRKGAGA